MEKVLVSACLLGQPVRYNGRDKRCDDEILERWKLEGRVVSVCPEVAGGLPVPRLPAEIAGGGGGATVLSGDARVVDAQKRDVTNYFLSGAEQALAIAIRAGARIAILKEGSPSCGSSYTYDGSFEEMKVTRPGVTTALLSENGVIVFSESELEAAERLIRELEGV